LDPETVGVEYGGTMVWEEDAEQVWWPPRGITDPSPMSSEFMRENGIEPFNIVDEIHDRRLFNV
jgi:hypothetical protein